MTGGRGCGGGESALEGLSRPQGGGDGHAGGVQPCLCSWLPFPRRLSILCSLLRSCLEASRSEARSQRGGRCLGSPLEPWCGLLSSSWGSWSCSGSSPLVHAGPVEAGPGALQGRCAPDCLCCALGGPAPHCCCMKPSSMGSLRSVCPGRCQGTLGVRQGLVGGYRTWGWSLLVPPPSLSAPPPPLRPASRGGMEVSVRSGSESSCSSSSAGVSSCPVRRLQLRNELEQSSCGSVLFNGYLPPPGEERLWRGSREGGGGAGAAPLRWPRPLLSPLAVLPARRQTRHSVAGPQLAIRPGGLLERGLVRRSNTMPPNLGNAGLLGRLLEERSTGAGRCQA